MSSLKGKIAFRLILDELSIEIAASRKRKSREGSNEECSSSDAISGFLFLQEGSTFSNPHSYCLLSVPHVLLQKACEAAAYDLPVVVTRYAFVELSGQMQQFPMTMLEIFIDGFHLLKEPAQSILTRNDFWTLSQFGRKELVDSAEMQTTRQMDTYNIIATVDAISPIIPLDPNDPFCLVELYDEDYPSKSCVLVLNGLHALLWQPAIHPGDTLLLEGLQRKLWLVPKALAAKPSFQHFTDRIPSFVFVFCKASNVFWSRDTVDTSFLYCDSTFPPTPLPLVCIEGIVLRVERKCRKQDKNKIRTVQWIDLKSDTGQEDHPIIRLFVAHFPMPTNLQLSLQSGATIRAVNVHPIEGYSHLQNGLQSFGACLRSTVTLVRPSSENQKHLVENTRPPHNENENFQTQQEKAGVPEEDYSIVGVVPYRLGKIKTSYREMILLRHVRRWLDEWFDNNESANATPLPSHDDIMVFLRSITEKKNIHIALQGGKSGGTRNPFSEFFDHAFDADIATERNNSSCGCNCTQEETQPSEIPLLVSLNEVRMAGLRVLGQRFADLVNHQQVSKGWSGSIHLSAKELTSELFGKGNCVVYHVAIGGFVSETSKDGEVLAMSDKICQLGVRILEPLSIIKGDFIVGRIESVVVSCLCLLLQKDDAMSSLNTLTGNAINVQSLPPLSNTTNNALVGSGALIQLGNFVLVASVQLICTEPKILGQKCMGERQITTPQQQGCRCTIETCLSTPRDWEGSSEILNGALIRSRLRLVRANSQGLSNCLVLTLSGFTKAGDDSMSPCHLQTIELKVSVPHNASKTIVFKRILKEILSEKVGVLDDECTLGVSWWTIAESYQASPIVAGGWDEYYGGTQDICTVVILSFSSKSLTTAKRGYVRWSCILDSLVATFVNMRHDSCKVPSQIIPTFNFIGTGKFWNGMLSRRPLRRSVISLKSGRVLGELQYASSCGISTWTLSDIFMVVCKTIRNGDPCTLSPSLVRRITGANFLGIAYCSAECKCTRCFESLVDTMPEEKMNERDAINDVWEQSFWHLPAPGSLAFLNGQEKANHSENSRPSRFSFDIEKSSLRCPNNCALDQYTVHWECSGILDDGTGQAKMYADREVALALLSFPESTIYEIEKGLWESRSGCICFTKSIPPTSELRERVKLAMSKAMQTGTNALKFLPPTVRAEYLMYHHCRTSAQASRKLDYFVRCKPLSDDVSYLNHTGVESFETSTAGRKLRSWTEVSTYSLPPLKLQLVDFSVPNSP